MDESMTEKIDYTIKELESWHHVRSRLNDNPNRRKTLAMDTLPRAIELLRKIREDKYS